MWSTEGPSFDLQTHLGYPPSAPKFISCQNISISRKQYSLFHSLLSLFPIVNFEILVAQELADTATLTHPYHNPLPMCDDPPLLTLPSLHSPKQLSKKNQVGKKKVTRPMKKIQVSIRASTSVYTITSSNVLF